MHYVPALQKFLSDELPRRGWSIKEFASRARLSLSNAYLIVRDGEDNVRSDTFENIAFALDMTPAELYVVIGKGRFDEDPERLPTIAAIRQVSKEHLDTVDRIVRAFVFSPDDHAMGPRKPLAQEARRKHRTRSSDDKTGPDKAPSVWWKILRHPLAPVVTAW